MWASCWLRYCREAALNESSNYYGFSFRHLPLLYWLYPGRTTKQNASGEEVTLELPEKLILALNDFSKKWK